MTSNIETTIITGNVERENVEEMLFHVLEHDAGLVLVTGPEGSGKTTFITRLIALETQKRNRYMISVSFSREEEVLPYVFAGLVAPTWDNTPEISNEYRTYFDWAHECAGDMIDDLMEQIYDIDPGIIFIDKLVSAEAATVALALASQGYLVVAGIADSQQYSGKKQLELMIQNSKSFADYAEGWEDVSGYNDGIIDLVLASEINLGFGDDDFKAENKRWDRVITFDNYV